MHFVKLHNGILKILQKLIISCQNYKKHEIHRIPFQNHENHKKIIITFQNHKILRIAHQNHENHENLIMPFQNHKNYKTLRIPVLNNEKH